MRNLLPLGAILFLAGAAANAQTSRPEYSESLHYSCLDSPFLKISAHFPRRDSFPAVEMRLTDPSGRNAGGTTDAHQIPNSHYGRIVEMPKQPDISKAVAIEICDARPGRYLMTTSERGGAEYRISVTGDDGKNENETQILYVRTAEDGRTCRYRFYFLMADGKVAIRWLDDTNHPLRFGQQPDCDPGPRASLATPGTDHLSVAR
jgi:hypothetical protein